MWLVIPSRRHFEKMVCGSQLQPLTLRDPQTAALRPVGTYPNLLWGHLPGEKASPTASASGSEGVQQSIVSASNRQQCRNNVLDLKPVTNQ